VAIALMFINALIVPAILYSLSSLVENTHTTNLLLRDALLKGKKFKFEEIEESLEPLTTKQHKTENTSDIVKCENCIYNKNEKECAIYDIKPKHMSNQEGFCDEYNSKD
jgi:hypothetical protein